VELNYFDSKKDYQDSLSRLFAFDAASHLAVKSKDAHEVIGGILSEGPEAYKHPIPVPYDHCKIVSWSVAGAMGGAWETGKTGARSSKTCKIVDERARGNGVILLQEAHVEAATIDGLKR